VTNVANASPASSVSEYSSFFNLGNSPSSMSDSPTSGCSERESSPTSPSSTRCVFVLLNDLRSSRHCAVGLVVPLCRYGGSLVLEIKILRRRQYRPGCIPKLCSGRYLPVEVFAGNMHRQSIHPSLRTGMHSHEDVP
jgi:hypothetical protein